MPIPATKGKVDLDTSQLSAYAVYNNLIPGVKAYQDTSESTQASKRKKSKKKANKKAAAEAAIKNELSKLMDKSQGVSTTSGNIKSTSTPNGQTPASVRKNKGKVNVTAEVQDRQSTGNKRSSSTSGSSCTQKEDQQVTTITDLNGTVNERKKRKRNKKKRKSESEDDRAVHTSSGVATEGAPPIKLRKLNQGKLPDGKYLPNPLATRNLNGAAKNLLVVDVEPAGSSKRQRRKNKGNAIEKEGEFNVKKSPVAIPENRITRKGRKSKESQVMTNANNTNEVCKAIPGQAILPLKKNKKQKANLPEPDIQDSSELPNVFDLINSKPLQNSVSHGESLFKWLIHPQPISVFKAEFWEKAPLLIKRNDVFPEYYEWILSTAALDDMLRKNVLKYSENLDITAYENGVRETISKEMTGRARPAAVWDYYATGHSVRILNPQTYCKPLWRLNASLQEWFGCFVGANVYLTPTDSQGFAPHYDDIEAFILQVEGKKHWKVYKPRSENSELPRFSSQDFKEDDDLGEPVMDVILEEGDLLYFPRGWIHQAKTVDGCHSMHITLSCYQQNTYADLLKQHFVESLEKLTTNDVNFRRGLPMDYMSFMGTAHSNSKDVNIISKRKQFKKALKKLMNKIFEDNVDDAADKMGKKFIWDSLPPYLTRREKDVTVNEDGEFLNHGRVRNRVEMDPDVEIKLLRKNCIRLIREENALRLYFSIENSLVYHVEEPQFLEVPEEFLSAIECLIKNYPEFTRIEDLPMESDDIAKKIQLISDFWERGIVMTKKPLEAGEIDDDFEFDEDDGEDILDDEDDSNADEEDDDSYSEDDEMQSEDESFIDDSSADMDGEFVSDEDNLDVYEEDSDENGVEIVNMDGSESDEDAIGFEDSD